MNSAKSSFRRSVSPSFLRSGRLSGFATLFFAATFVPAAFAQGAAAGAAGGGAGAAGGVAAPAAGQTSAASGQNGTTTTSAAKARTDTQQRDASRDDADHRAEVPAGSQDVLTEFQQMVETTTGRRVPIFGASLFSGVPSTFAPVEQVPVSSSYILGPGDEIALEITGQINRTLSLTVDRTGAISVPELGSVQVASLPYGQLTDYLNHQLGRIYRNFTVNAQLGQLRTIQVFVVGEARRPGSYSISSLSTLLNAVFASGGPAPTGSVRDIQVRRGDKTIVHFDLYDLLLHGDKSKDITLASGDVIYIPFVGPQVAIVGSVDVPAIYELKGEKEVKQAVALAGGTTSVAAGNTVRLERVHQHSDRSVEDVSLDTPADQQSLRDGDIISVTSIIDRFRDAVTLRGNVANPGRYVWKPGMHIADLFPNKEALITRNYWRKRNQLGQLAQDYIPQSTESTSTEGALQLNGNKIDAQSSDVANKGTAGSEAGGNSVGAALTGNNSIFEAKTDVVLSAPDIDWSYAVIERLSSDDLTTSLIPFNLGKIVLDHDPSQNFELLPGDVITIFSKADLRVPSSQQTKFVRLEGEFVASGVYSTLPGETLRQLVARAGGFTPDAYLYASEFTRESTRRVEQQRLNEYADELEAQISAVTSSNQARALSASDSQAAGASQADAQTAVARLRRIAPIGRIVLDLHPDSQGLGAIPDIALEDGDRFVVPRVPSNVNVEGQVYSANAFVFSPQQRVLDYLKRAGGPDRQADRKRIFVLRADGSVASRQYGEVFKAPIYPGDTVIVPPILDKRSVLQRVTDIAQIVGNFGLGAAALYLIAR